MTTIICKDVYGNEYPTDASELVQRVGVYAVVVRDDKILLTRQWGGYGIVGGGVDNGETLEKALAREVQEETGLTVAVGELFYHATTFFKKNAQATAHQSLQLYFRCEYVDGQIHSDDITDSEQGYTDGAPEWVDINNIDTIDFYHSVELTQIMAAMQG